MSRRSEAVKRWRKNTKNRIVESMGGKCQICGYDRCNQAMDLHHIDPSEKEFGFGAIMAHPTKWEKIVVELRKCILFCNRCHQEFHAGIIDLPSDFQSFNETYFEYRKAKEDYDPDPCPVCGNKKPVGAITCSKKCAAKRTGKVNWKNVELEKLIKEHSYVAIGNMLGVSDTAVRKRAKKLGLI